MEKEKERRGPGGGTGADKKPNKQHLVDDSDWELAFSSLLGLLEAPL